MAVSRAPKTVGDEMRRRTDDLAHVPRANHNRSLALDPVRELLSEIAEDVLHNLGIGADGPQQPLDV
jgi:hypothetical protein